MLDNASQLYRKVDKEADRLDIALVKTKTALSEAELYN